MTSRGIAIKRTILLRRLSAMEGIRSLSMPKVNARVESRSATSRQTPTQLSWLWWKSDVLPIFVRNWKCPPKPRLITFGWAMMYWKLKPKDSRPRPWSKNGTFLSIMAIWNKPGTRSVRCAERISQRLLNRRQEIWLRLGITPSYAFRYVDV